MPRSIFNNCLMDRDKFEKMVFRALGPDFITKPSQPVFHYDSRALQRKAKNMGVFKALEKIYAEIPGVACGPCGDVCCRESPDVYILEYLYIRRFLEREKDAAFRASIIERGIRWAFLLLADREVFCPFLVDRKCSIYPVRPFNCRAWGLEDAAYYSVKSARASEAMKRLDRHLKLAGVNLNGAPATEMVLPRCENISIEAGRRFSEDEILEADFRVALLHKNLIPPEAFKSDNFHTPFPLHILYKKYPASEIENLRKQAMKERIEIGKSALVSKIASSFDDLP